MVFYEDWCSAVKGLPDGQRLEVYEAIFDYAFQNLTPENPLIAALTAIMRMKIDKDQMAFEDKVEKRREAGRLGGLKRAENYTKAKQGQANVANAKNAIANSSKAKQVQANQAENENENENENISTNVDVIKKNKQKSESDLTALEVEFEKFRSAYKGQKRGFKAEFENLKKKYPNDWRNIIPLLMPALEKMEQWRAEASKRGEFVPQYAMLQTWINQSRWTSEFPTYNDINKTQPQSQPRRYDENAGFGGMNY